MNRSSDLFKEFLVAYDDFVLDHANMPDNVSEISVECIDSCIIRMKLGKAGGLDGIESEHLSYAHPILISLIRTLFNAMLQHSYVPNKFGIGVMIPLIKDKNGDATSMNNYRGITLSPAISKLFEMCLLEMFDKYLTTSDLQFGFKKKLGCSNAIYSLQTTIQHFNNNGSTVNVCLLDMSKAFDKVNHYGLYLKLMKRGVPPVFLRVLINWYSKCSAVVRWNNSLSRCFRLPCGVRQGGVLSPVLFTVYVNDIITRLQMAKLGCVVGNQFVGCFMYADDLVLVSASVSMLQAMIDICELEANWLDMKFNGLKSMIIRIGSAFNRSCADILLNSVALDYVNKAKYLGVYICAAKRFKFCFNESKCKATMNDVVMMQLINTYCKPLLLYGCECIQLNVSEKCNLQRAWHTIFWKIFHTNDVSCISDIQSHLGQLPLSVEMDLKQIYFLKNMLHSDNNVVKELSGMFGMSVLEKLLSSYNLKECSKGTARCSLLKQFCA